MTTVATATGKPLAGGCGQAAGFKSAWEFIASLGLAAAAPPRQSDGPRRRPGCAAAAAAEPGRPAGVPRPRSWCPGQPDSESEKRSNSCCDRPAAGPGPERRVDGRTVPGPAACPAFPRAGGPLRVMDHPAGRPDILGRHGLVSRQRG